MNADKRGLPTRFALVNGRIVLPTAIVMGQALLIDNGHIGDIVPVAALDHDLPQIDVGGRLISPGLIDIHIHGARGHSFNEPTAEAFATITRENARRGVTSLLATTATDSIENLLAVLAFAETWMAQTASLGSQRDNEVFGAQVLGVHGLRQVGDVHPEKGDPSLVDREGLLEHQAQCLAAVGGLGGPAKALRRLPHAMA